MEELRRCYLRTPYIHMPYDIDTFIDTYHNELYSKKTLNNLRIENVFYPLLRL